ncbi:putative fimbrial-like adhesin protein [Salmonella enterica subsp. enterica serovar Kentucky]|nr:putative fimbrial-like adhesin protein [Salmonella enterica subsp. enterica serovar Kentucky]
MKLFLFIVMLLILPETYAACTGEITYQDNLIIREDFTINPNQSATYSHNFNDTTCSGTYKITRMDPSDIIVGLYNDTVKLKLKIAWADNNTLTMPFTTGYTVTVEPASSGANVNISAGSGNSVLINGVVSITSASSATQFTAGLRFLGCLLAGRGWNACAADYNSYLRGAGLYSFDLFVSYDRKQTTCKPEDLTITLPNIALSELYNTGKVSNKNAADNIRLLCDNLFGNAKQASRKMTVYLSSSDLIPDSYSVLRGAVNNGVGFILESGGKTVNISNTAEQGNASTLWKVDQVGTPLNSDMITIPIIASYYVYDRDNIKPGDLKATALIYVKYD